MVNILPLKNLLWTVILWSAYEVAVEATSLPSTSFDQFWSHTFNYVLVVLAGVPAADSTRGYRPGQYAARVHAVQTNHPATGLCA